MSRFDQGESFGGDFWPPVLQTELCTELACPGGSEGELQAFRGWKRSPAPPASPVWKHLHCTSTDVGFPACFIYPMFVMTLCVLSKFSVSVCVGAHTHPGHRGRLVLNKSPQYKVRAFVSAVVQPECRLMGCSPAPY